MSELWDARVYDVLVELAGAHDDESNRAQFHFFWNERGSYREYRFIGSLGFGGKFWAGRSSWHVSCYPEDSTEYRNLVIGNTNDRLAALKAEFDAERVT